MKSITISLNEAEKAELDDLVLKSGLSRTDFLKKCALPSKGSTAIFLDGASILAKLSELFNLIQCSPHEVNEKLPALTNDIFQLFGQLMDYVKSGGEAQ